MNIKNLNFLLLKHGSMLHTFFVFLILYAVNIHPNTPIYWVFILNHVMFAYFVFVRGCALGIRRTIDIISHEEAAKVIQEDINKNN